MDLTSLGFRAAGHQRLFERRKRVRIYPASPTAIAYSSLTGADRRLIFEYDFQGRHVDFADHRLRFRLRVPNLQWFESVPETGRVVGAHGIEMTLAEARDRLQDGLLDPQELPRCAQATRLFARVRVSNGDQVVLLEQEELNLLCEVLRWRRDPRQEVLNAGAGLGATNDPPAPIDGVDMCSSPGEVERLYSPDGVYISMRIPHDLLASHRGFWPAQRVLRFEFTMASPALVLQSELPPQDMWRAQLTTRGRLVEPATQVAAQLLHYELLDARLEVDEVQLSEAAEAQLRAVLTRGEGVPVTYRQYRHHQRLFEPHMESVVVKPRFRLANVTRWFSVFRPDSQLRSGFHDSFAFRNPDVQRVQWVQGTMRVPEHPIMGAHDLYECAERTLGERSDRLNVYNFVGSFRFEVDALPSADGLGRDVYFARFTQPRSFHLVCDFRRDLDRTDESGMSGVSTFQDHDLELHVQRSARVPRAAAELPQVPLRQDVAGSSDPYSFRAGGGYELLHPLLNLTRDVRVYFARELGTGYNLARNELCATDNTQVPSPAFTLAGATAQWQIEVPLPGEQWVVDTFLEHTAQVQFTAAAATVTAF